jgi:hypothetical protein
MLARLLVSLGAPAAAVGFTLYGMATTFVKHDDDIANIAYILIAVGLVATVIGAVMYRITEKQIEAALQLQAQRAQTQTQRVQPQAQRPQPQKSRSKR